MNKPFALLIEDDRDIAALFRHVLDVAGYQTEIVLNGEDGMKRLSALEPDIVLLDLQLPGMSGIDILKEMRADDRLKTIPVVVVTAYPIYSDNLPVEPDLFLIKPVDIKDLSSLIQRLRATKETMQEPPYDEVTQLYTISFFSIRLLFGLERIKQTENERFGVMFAELDPFEQLEEQMGESELNAFLRKMAEQFGSNLRPTDTIAWSQDGYFLALIEGITVSDDVFTIIAKRVKNGLAGFLEQNKPGVGLQTRVGMLLCDENCIDVQDVLDDVNFLRSYVRGDQSTTGPWIYRPGELGKLRELKDQ